MSIRDNLKQIRENIRQACQKANRPESEITLIAVSKTFPANRIREAYQAGITHFAENKVQEAVQKFAEVKDIPIKRHFIGHLQSNKIRDMLACTDMMHSVDSFSLAEKIHEKLLKENRTLDVLIQVNTSREESKWGIAPEKAGELIASVRALPMFMVKGLMTIGAHTDEESHIKKSFYMLRKLRDENTPADMPVLSMGMSSDYMLAIEEGATHIRIGGALFGDRTYT